MGFEQLPTELVLHIFSALDPRALSAMVVVSRKYWAIFRENENKLSKEALRSFLGDDLVPEAIAVQRTSRTSEIYWNRRKRQEAYEVLDDYEASRKGVTVEYNWTLSAALTAQDFHYYASKFAEEVLDSCLSHVSKDDVRNLQAVALEASPHELQRFKRALYWFEIYCNVFGQDRKRILSKYKKYDPVEQREKFWDRFAPWEVERLACVFEHLMPRVMPIILDLSTFSTEWIKYLATVRQGVNRGAGAYLLSLGLRELHNILNTTIEDRRKPGFLCGDDVNSHPLFLEASIAEWDKARQETCDAYSNTDCFGTFKGPLVVDEDDGPEKIWRWVHKLDPVKYSVSLRETRDFRSWGYVFWDKSRLESWAIDLEQYWEPDDFYYPVSDDEQDIDEEQKQIDERARDLIRCGIISVNMDTWDDLGF